MTIKRKEVTTLDVVRFNEDTWIHIDKVGKDDYGYRIEDSYLPYYYDENVSDTYKVISGFNSVSNARQKALKAVDVSKRG